MNTNKLINKIEKNYRCHGIKVNLVLQSVDQSGNKLIFQIYPRPGTKTSLIFDRAEDIGIALQLPLFQPFRDGLKICLAVSKNAITQNSLTKMLTSQKFHRSRYFLPVAIGYNMKGEMVFADLAQMPHAMYAGTTNSGKSVGLLCMIMSLIIKQPVCRVNLILFDVGANTLELFKRVPHLSHPIVKDAVTGIYVVNSLIVEMEKRIELDKTELRCLPAIVCVIDEYVSLINNIEDKKQAQKLVNQISNLIRRGRHAKIHIVLSTQDPTQKNMKVDIGNITTRLAFACAKYHNSITILGEGGAEKLPGKGAMLYKSNDYPNPVYLQGAYISPEEVDRLVNYVKSVEYDLSSKFLIPEYDPSEQMIQEIEEFEDAGELQGRTKELADIIMWTLGRDTISASQIMNRFSMGNRAYNIVDKLFKMKIITEKFANQPRKVLPQSVGDISESVMQFLQSNGFSLEAVSEIFAKRIGNGLIAKDNIILV